MSTYLGQNFLIDSKIKNYIFELTHKIYNQLDCSSLIEIGPGKGAITKKIHTISDNFIVIEKDTTLIPYLKDQQENGEWDIQHILNQDVLEINTNQLQEFEIQPDETLVVGNLPYYITSPILRKFFGTGNQEYQAGFFMMQHEVGEKIQTQAKKKSYLWRILNYAYTVEYCKIVPAKAFNPTPRVKSCLIKITKKQNIPSLDFEQLKIFLDSYSPYSRKTLGAIQKLHEKKSKKVHTIPEILTKRRLEELNWDDMEYIIN